MARWGFALMAAVLVAAALVGLYLAHRYPGVDPGPWTHRNYR